ncbi:1,4-dihydroxy-2-naphthoate octaprenyltransferase [Haloferax elongans ATCC BAA-1513]|uniref:1,4-dihydroxy-2-naphthoate octaprenyltransferase n=1 Tax=Haloferax elongans ATCC BAA-1513 TaxID=1230453 RepID=M0HEY2_HALEO|nr:prenyltransferase [Haloferax elongans]ELZ83040.1 1,4-dihydroxy-2-naphthoate octaprenyltransferase [Haloferax elongans ATCC BAA-1513]
MTHPNDDHSSFDASTEERPRWVRLRALFEMARPEQVLLMALVYALGVAAAVAWGASLDFGHLGVAFAAFTPVALTIHYANEYADYETDLLADRTPFSGGSGSLARTGLPRSLARRATLASGVLSVVVVAGGVTAGLLSIAEATLLAGIFILGVEYSLPPLALAWRGVGAVDNAILGGLLLPVYGVLAASGSLTVVDVVPFVPFTLLVFVNLLATTWPDRDPDAAVGKRTLVTRLSTRTLRGLHVGGVVAAYGSLLVATGTVIPVPVTFATLLALPFSVWGAVRYTRSRSPFPAVAAMVVAAAAHFCAWAVFVA